MNFSQTILTLQTINSTVKQQKLSSCSCNVPKCTKLHLAANLRPDPLGGLTALPQIPWLDSRGPTTMGKGGECAQFCIKIWVSWWVSESILADHRIQWWWPKTGVRLTAWPMTTDHWPLMVNMPLSLSQHDITWIISTSCCYPVIAKHFHSQVNSVWRTWYTESGSKLKNEAKIIRLGLVLESEVIDKMQCADVTTCKLQMLPANVICRCDGADVQMFGVSGARV